MENEGFASARRGEAEQNGQSAIFKEQCIDYMFIDAYTVFDVIYNKDASVVANRTIYFTPPEGKPVVTTDFKSDGKAYEMKDDFKSEKELFLDTTDSSGSRVLTRVDSKTAEYKKAVDDADKLGFNNLPSCSSVVDTGAKN